jgi:hypothetical protein
MQVSLILVVGETYLLRGKLELLELKDLGA